MRTEKEGQAICHEKRQCEVKLKDGTTRPMTAYEAFLHEWAARFGKCAFIALMLVTMAFAKDKVYGKMGTVSFEETTSNAEAHVTVNGTTYDSYCNVGDSRADCTDNPGNLYLTLADGGRYAFFILTGFPSTGTGDPLLHEKTFQYRESYYDGKQPAICVADGRKEACYAIRKRAE